MVKSVIVNVSVKDYLQRFVDSETAAVGLIIGHVSIVSFLKECAIKNYRSTCSF